MILVLRRLFLAATPLALAVVLWFHRFLLVLLLGRRRWVKRQPGAFAGAIRVSSGDVEGLGPKWKRGYGRWVGDVLVWTKAPLFFRNEFVPIDRIAGERSAHRNEVKTPRRRTRRHRVRVGHGQAPGRSKSRAPDAGVRRHDSTGRPGEVTRQMTVRAARFYDLNLAG
jgi:hypothetical protein